MSQSVFFHVEYRRKGEEKWNLYKNKLPITKEEYEEKVALAKKCGYNTRDLVAEDNPYNGEKNYYVVRDCIASGGYLRDSFATRSFYCEYDDSMVHAGLPDDLSEDLKAWDIETKEKDYDWRSDLSWFTLGGLSSYCDKLYDNIMNNAIRQVTAIVNAGLKKDIGGLNEKVEKILGLLDPNLVGNPTEKPVDTEDGDDCEDDERYAWEDFKESLSTDVSQYASVVGFYKTVENIVEEFLTIDYMSQIDVRIIMYIA